MILPICLIIISLTGCTNKNNEDKTKEKFLSKFLNKEINLDDNLTWKYSYKNPVQATDIIGVFIDNKENFNINMWISLDKRFFH